MKYMLYLYDDFDKLKLNIIEPILSDNFKVEYVYQSIDMLKHPIIYRINPDLITPSNQIKYHRKFIEQKEILRNLQPHQYFKIQEVKIWNT